MERNHNIRLRGQGGGACCGQARGLGRLRLERPSAPSWPLRSSNVHPPGWANPKKHGRTHGPNKPAADPQEAQDPKGVPLQTLEKPRRTKGTRSTPLSDGPIRVHC